MVESTDNKIIATLQSKYLSILNDSPSESRSWRALPGKRLSLLVYGVFDSMRRATFLHGKGNSRHAGSVLIDHCIFTLLRPDCASSTLLSQLSDSSDEAETDLSRTLGVGTTRNSGTVGQ